MKLLIDNNNFYLKSEDSAENTYLLEMLGKNFTIIKDKDNHGWITVKLHKRERKCPNCDTAVTPIIMGEMCPECNYDKI
jgi:hypothetical protein